MVALGRSTPRSSTQLRYLAAWLLPVIGLTATGCATSHEQLVAFLRSHEAEVGGGTYIVRPPDAISIHAPGIPEVDGASQNVRSDGRIVLRLLGEVDVAGLSPEGIAKKLEAQLSRYYVEPEVIVDVSGYNSQFYYVFGEVGGAGPKPYTGRDTLLRALAEARPTFLAWRSKIRVTRPNPEEGERKTIVVDLERMVRTGDTTENILLQEGDIIEVPPTPLAWVGLRIRELLYPVSPVLSAYSTPAQFMAAQEQYEDEADSGDRSNSARSRLNVLR